jgi:hypothetical protein
MRLPRDIAGRDRIGTLAAILSEVAAHLGVERDALADDLFGS